MRVLFRKGRAFDNYSEMDVRHIQSVGPGLFLWTNLLSCVWVGKKEGKRDLWRSVKISKILKRDCERDWPSVRITKIPKRDCERDWRSVRKTNNIPKRDCERDWPTVRITKIPKRDCERDWPSVRITKIPKRLRKRLTFGEKDWYS